MVIPDDGHARNAAVADQQPADLDRHSPRRAEAIAGACSAAAGEGLVEQDGFE